MPDRHGQAIWPGVNAYQACTYTCSHGISPGVAQLTMYQQPSAPAIAGDLVFTDNFTTITIRNCKVDTLRDRGGGVWDLMILDRRWKWKELSAVSGWYNQFDPFSKYLPYTMRTPLALAELCLKAMGEKNYRIILPNVAVLPPVQWDYAVPANALASLCDSLGCRVILRLDTDTVLIAPLGSGELLPTTGSIRSDCPELDLPERPDSLVVVGQPTRHDVRLLLEAVADDWDDVIRPNDALDYAPGRGVVKSQIVKITPASVTTNDTFTVKVNDIEYEFVATSSLVANVTAGLEAAINQDWPRLPFKATDETTHLTIEGADGVPFDVFTSAEVGNVGDEPTLTWVLTQAASDGIHNLWQSTPPPTFSGLAATKRMTRLQALEYAKRTVWRYYRVRACDPTDPSKPLIVPGYGPIVRREQLVLLQSRAEQIAPSAQDERPLDQFGKPPINEFYNGHSRDKPAAIYGVHWLGQASGQNSEPDFRIREPFSIDPEKQLVVFGNHVYRQEGGHVFPARLVLETSVHIRDPLSNALVCFEHRREFTGPKFGTPPAYFRKDDVQASYIGVYDPLTWKLLRVQKEDTDAKQRSIFYLIAIAATYEITGAQNRTWNGLEPIFNDGAIQQVTYSVGPAGGTTTQASRNSEHASYVPAYPARRRAEYLPPLGGPVQFPQLPPPGPGGSLGYGPDRGEKTK